MQPEEERLEQIKEWWKEYRWTIIIGVTLGIGGIGGVNGWLAYSKSQSEQVAHLQRLILRYEQFPTGSASRREKFPVLYFRLATL